MNASVVIWVIAYICVHIYGGVVQDFNTVPNIFSEVMQQISTDYMWCNRQ
jgi:hypothetical protein